MICETPSCERPIHNKRLALCKRCYSYKWAIEREASDAPKCTVEDCQSVARVKGLCFIHYKRARRNGGNPLDAPGRGSPGKRRGIRSMKGEYITNSGYRRIRTPDGRWIDEHRHAMEIKLDRELLPSENVHHIDGSKLNNEPENLELWIKPQPSGVRVEDAVAWAREILRRYT